ncbi:MAG: 50S ribosomal protein L24 [Myxococcales bacterium]|nr:50S ribosomal protein L24 [Myxococcales bacterium]
MHVKKGDLVVVISGKGRGKTGKVKRVLPAENRVIVEGVNLVKKHQRPTKQNPSGGIVEMEAPVHASNVLLLDGKTNRPTRTKQGRNKDGKKVRVAVKTGTVFD